MKKNTINAAIEAAKKELVNNIDALGFCADSVEFAAMKIAAKYPPKKGFAAAAAVRALLANAKIWTVNDVVYDVEWPSENEIADGMKIARRLLNKNRLRELSLFSQPLIWERQEEEERAAYRSLLPSSPDRNWSGQTLLYAEYSGGELRGGNFEKSDLYGSDFSRTDLAGANFAGADLRDSDLGWCCLDRSSLVGANLAGADLSQARLVEACLPEAVLRSVTLEGATLYKADLKKADLRRAYLYKADLAEADLSEANLRGADFEEADLNKADLKKADLTGADLTGAILAGADLAGAILAGAVLTGANLRGANLRGAKLRGACLIGADLEGADLEGVDLSEVLWLTGGRIEIPANGVFNVAGHNLAVYNGEVFTFGSEGAQKVSTIPVTLSYWDDDRWAYPAPRALYKVRVTQKGDRCVATVACEHITVAGNVLLCYSENGDELSLAVRKLIENMADDEYVGQNIRKRDLSAVAFSKEPADEMTLYVSGTQSQEVEIPGYGTVSWLWTETVEDDGSILLQSWIETEEGREAVSWLEDEDGDYVRDTGHTLFSIKGVAYTLTVRPASSCYPSLWTDDRAVRIYVRRQK